METVRFDGSWERWAELVEWMDHMTPGWFFTLEQHGGVNGHMRERLINPTERQRTSSKGAGTTISFTDPRHFMVWKLAWQGME